MESFALLLREICVKCSSLLILLYYCNILALMVCLIWYRVYTMCDCCSELCLLCFRISRMWWCSFNRMLFVALFSHTQSLNSLEFMLPFILLCEIGSFEQKKTVELSLEFFLVYCCLNSSPWSQPLCEFSLCFQTLLFFQLCPWCLLIISIKFLLPESPFIQKEIATFALDLIWPCGIFRLFSWAFWCKGLDWNN